MALTGTRRSSALRSSLATIAAWLVVAGLAPASMQAQLPLDPVGTPFEMTGFIQRATLDNADDTFSGGTLLLNNHPVVVPRNTIFQMPATALTWQELFKFAPAPYGPTQTGLALQDSPKPATTFEVTVQGNRIGDRYIAGLIFVAQLSLQSHQGFINYIDYGTGEVFVGGTPGVRGGARLRINDPIGRFGRAWSNDVRFTIDEDNPTVRSETGYPMCVPRFAPEIGDPLCPEGNRPRSGAGYQTIFTMPVRSAPNASDALTSRPLPDPWRMAPFEIGDYITYAGQVTTDASGDYITAYSVSGNVGIFTTTGSLPTYVAIDVLLMGTGPTTDVALAQEGAKRTVVEGFTTDPNSFVTINAVDVNSCSGDETDRFWASQSADPGAPAGAVAGRWRFRPAAPLFDLKGFPFLPATREVHVVSGNGTAMTPNGLSAGEYTAPNFEFIFTENLGIGNTPVPGNYDSMPFLANGSGPWFGGGPFGTTRAQGIVGTLAPFPRAASPVAPACSDAAIQPPVARASATVGAPNQSVASGAPVTLTGNTSFDPAGRSIKVGWQQISGPTVTLTQAGKNAKFTAPVVPAGSAPVVLGFMVTVDNGKFASTATSFVTVQPGS